MRKPTLRTLTAIAIVFATTPLVLGSVGCVDGETPNCSDAAARCGPDFDAYPPSSLDGADDTSPTDAPSDGAETGPADTAPADAPGDVITDGGLLDGLLG